MAKAGWDDLLARVPEPHLLVAILPDSASEDTLLNAHSAQRLLVRLIRNLPTQGEFAVTVSRRGGQREILCAFGNGADARLFANITNASATAGARYSYSFLLDESAERKLFELAGPPRPHRRVRSDQRWQL